ncbi:MAG TPA: response regulator [Candidatus Sulfomarinibacteraceae bacterium]|nr:response regulator [Candidatus Sulfomarinibacteraceae bacterium]
MIQVLLAAPRPDVRAALRLLLLDLSMQVVGEAADWSTTLALAHETEPEMLLVDWELISISSGHTLAQLRAACPSTVVIVLISQLDARQQAALSAGADAFISKGEMPDRVAARLRAAAKRIRFA